MNFWRSSWILAFVIGCGQARESSPGMGGASGIGGDDGDAAVTLCNGDPGYRLQYFTLQDAESQRLWIKLRNGAQFLHIKGDCTYVARLGEIDRAPAVAGKLSPEEAAVLAEDLQLDEFEALDGTISQTPGAHQPRSSVVFAGNHVGCHFDCQQEPYNNPEDQAAHAVLAPIFEKLLPWHERLATRGQPLAGDVRVAVIPINTDNWRFGTMEWPLERSPLDFLQQEGGSRMDVTIVSDPDAADLIKMRNETGSYPWGASPIEFEGSYYDVVIDELLPGESDEGSVLPDLTAD